MQFMKKIYPKQPFPIPSFQNISHLRHHFHRIRLFPKSPFPSPNLLDCTNRYQRRQNRPHYSVHIFMLHLIMNHLLSSVVILWLRDRTHPLRTLLDSSRITSEDQNPPKIRSSQHWIKHLRSITPSIYCSLDPRDSTVRGSTRHPLCDIIKRRHHSEAPSSHWDPELRPLLLVTAGICSVVFIITDILFLDRCRAPCIPLLPILLNPQRSTLLTYLIYLLCNTTSLPDISLLPDFHFFSHNTDSPTLSSIMANQQDQPNAQESAVNPIEWIFNKECTMCKTHTIMINRYVKHFNDLKNDYEADSRSKRKKLEKQKEEIENLKGRCSHLEEAIEQIRALSQSYQAEASTKASARKDPLPDDSATQKLP